MKATLRKNGYHGITKRIEVVIQVPIILESIVRMIADGEEIKTRSGIEEYTARLSIVGLYGSLGSVWELLEQYDISEAKEIIDQALRIILDKFKDIPKEQIIKEYYFMVQDYLPEGE